MFNMQIIFSPLVPPLITLFFVLFIFFDRIDLFFNFPFLYCFVLQCFIFKNFVLFMEFVNI